MQRLSALLIRPGSYVKLQQLTTNSSAEKRSFASVLVVALRSRHLHTTGGHKDSPKSTPKRTINKKLQQARKMFAEEVERAEAKMAGLRQWDYTDAWDTFVSGGAEKGTPFTVISYNILAQNLLEAHPYLYREHDRRALSWDHRYHRLVQEILAQSPHILCLQEMQESHLDGLRAGFATLDLDVIYKKRTGYKDDGCAIMYNRKLFTLIESHTIEYFQPGVQILNRENVAILAKFAAKGDPSQRFVVATTHLLYNPRRQDVRLAQVQVLLAELDRVAYEEDGYMPIILTGDFNLKPFTAPYELLTSGRLRYDNLTEKTLEEGNRGSDRSGKELLPPKLGITDSCQHIEVIKSNVRTQTRLHHSDKNGTDIIEIDEESHFEDSNLVFQSGELQHRFNFSSVYRHCLGTADQEASTYQDEWITVDYIFFTPNVARRHDAGGEERLKLLARYKLPSAEQCNAAVGMIPNLYFGSDHLALGAKFLLLPTRTSKL